ncbi:hypothetical protein CC2G_005132 [Coprinopsis cinerea AmutBmut pab1-1]|nr:hypothetical protein CC2G_012096 [Coprinopsis cinerea AmutBmut pab1-1]KAG2019719.1 hypothetical protein CC2G_005132 [Coprinopsis cinerea AmutBmut pab1-1]
MPDVENLNPKEVSPGDEAIPHKDMPSITKKDRPTLSKDDAMDVVRYLELLEQLFKGIVKTDRAKKIYATRYIDDPILKRQWEAIPEYATSTWNDFKRAVLRYYPEGEGLSRGSRPRLMDVFKRHREISQVDVGRMARLALAIRPEAEGLEALQKETGHVLVTNREIVSNILGCLSPNFRDALRFRLTLEESKPATEAAGTTSKRDWYGETLEDRVPWGRVLEIAQDLTRQTGAHNAYGGFSSSEDRDYDRNLYRNPPAASTPAAAVKSEPTDSDFRSFAKAMIKEQQQFVLEQQRVNAKFVESLRETKEQFMAESRKNAEATEALAGKLDIVISNPHNLNSVRETQYRDGASRMRSNQGSRDSGKGTSDQQCFYCNGTDHWVMRCPSRLDDLRKKKIYTKGSEVYLSSNHQRISAFSPDGRSQKERVADMTIQGAYLQGKAMAQSESSSHGGEDYGSSRGPTYGDFNTMQTEISQIKDIVHTYLLDRKDSKSEGVPTIEERDDDLDSQLDKLGDMNKNLSVFAQDRDRSGFP